MKHIIWITGAGSGIGKAIAQKAARSSGNTLILSGRKPEMLEIFAEELTVSAPNCQVLCVPCDVSLPESVSSAYSRIVREVGTPTILVNNAGSGSFSPFLEESVENFDRIFGANVRGLFLCSQAVLPAMMEQKAGIILNILSISAVKAFPNGSLYGASKAGALAMMRSVREEVRALGIKVVNVLPGATETEIWSQEMRDLYGERMIPPEELAETIVALFDVPRSVLVEEIILRPQLGDL